MKSKKIIPALQEVVENQWPGMVDLMNFAETEPQKIKRWLRLKKERPWYLLKKGRTQNVLQHSYSLGLLGENILIMIEDQLARPLDSRLLQLCFKIHDWGEPLLKRDICSLDKKDTDDSDEYVAFVKKIKDLPIKVQERYKEAFLLQFCFNADISCFPVDAVATMDILLREKRDEAIFFKAVENIEYLSFAIEQAIKKGDFNYLITVSRNQFEKLDGFSELLPALKLVWNEKLKERIRVICISAIINNPKLDRIR